MSHVFPVQNVFREDVVVNGDDRENILTECTGRKRRKLCSSEDGRLEKRGMA